MAKASLSAEEVAELMKLISIGISVKKMVNNINTETLIEVLKKFEKPVKNDKEILRDSEDYHDFTTDGIDELSNEITKEINLRSGYSNCEDCND